jgi:hypothetical protein
VFEPRTAHFPRPAVGADHRAADVYLDGGRVDVASAYLRKAINRYDRKGNRAGARKTRRLLAEFATPVGHTRAAGSASDQGATRISS